MNKVILVGRLTNDPELQTIADNMQICKFGLAVSKRFKKNDGETADFFNIIVWNKQAEHCQKFLTKGSQISLSGRIEIQKWTDKENEVKYKTIIVAEEVCFLSSNQKNSEDTKPKSAKPQNTKSSSSADVDDLPF